MTVLPAFPQAEYKQRLAAFFKKEYQKIIRIPETEYLAVEGYDHVMVNPCLGESVILKHARARFGLKISSGYSTASGGMSRKPVVPFVPYFFAHDGRQNACIEDGVELVADSVASKISEYTTISDYLLMWQFLYAECGVRLDDFGWTILSTLNGKGNALAACSSGNQLFFHAIPVNSESESFGARKKITVCSSHDLVL
jgi:hypothetical protein